MEFALKGREFRFKNKFFATESANETHFDKHKLYEFFIK